MEALKNTSMMVILAGVFYGAYQMFMSDPASLKPSANSQMEANIDPQAVATNRPMQPDLNQTTQNQSMQGFQGTQMPPAQSPTIDNNRLSQGNNFSSPNASSLQQNTNMPRGLSNPENMGGTASNGSTRTQLGNSPNPTVAQTPPTSPEGYAPTNPEPFPPASQNLMPNPANEEIGRVGFAAPEMTPAATTLDQGRGSQDLLPIQTLNRSPLNNAQPNSNSGISPPPGTTGVSPWTAQLKATLEAAAIDFQSGNSAKALQDLSRWYDQPLAQEDREHLIGWLDNLAGEVIYSTQPTLGELYVTQPSDTLSGIASKFQIPARLIANINGYGQDVGPDQPLQAGVSLKVLPGPFRAEVNMNNGELTLFLKNLYAGRYKFQSGESAPERPSNETITHVSTQGIPAETDGQNYQPLTAENPFGRYCMVVGQLLVVHSPGANPGNGCVMLSESDMVDLLVILGKGSEVRVIR